MSHRNDGGARALRVAAILSVALAATLVSLAAASATGSTLLLRKPAISRTQIAFSYGGDLWIVDRNGGDARRLTSDVGIETTPRFSPDGTMIAFTGEYDGNEDVYVIPTAGGIPRRLRTQQLRALQSAVHRERSRRIARGAPATDGRGGVLLS